MILTTYDPPRIASRRSTSAAASPRATAPAVARRTSLDRERLLAAVGRDELFLEYQSMVSMARDEVTCVEALVRWRHPTFGTLLPGAFVPLSERDGSVDILGLWVLDQACADRRKWLDLGLGAFPVAVNLSARQLLDAGFADRVEACLARHRLPQQLVRFELTESAPMPTSPQAEKNLEDLVALGIELCIDDFTMGHASVLALAEGRFDQIKIPRELIANVAQGKRVDTVVEMMVELGHRLGLRIIAEGIETPLQRDFLRAIGCDEGQGYLFGRPAEADVVIERISGQRVTRPMPRLPPFSTASGC